ncbi:hypothetical protein TTHERM_000529532 (macronuclear) [Tetrahymena thermophila SB210]|uniref:Uncharacterized protein n=1 Tax=Tetrahymena thermophila (strain SB210) TaxID=312017 RepID=W7X4V7_TETTS|nr:hypothetical protein TTHERM_000529532 [Tetrahymena thermophila SB210]EWS72452.1 hypothetical protein TTHERM_000529532 [Tetrahymena thermophila SB210]|eukprot:XP_012654997.1 hypothetical protein TTHERM_000529532 [Tetrahymena thermophila SB210]
MIFLINAFIKQRENLFDSFAVNEFKANSEIRIYIFVKKSSVQFLKNKRNILKKLKNQKQKRNKKKWDPPKSLLPSLPLVKDLDLLQLRPPPRSLLLTDLLLRALLLKRDLLLLPRRVLVRPQPRLNLLRSLPPSLPPRLLLRLLLLSLLLRLLLRNLLVRLLLKKSELNEQVWY